MGARRVRFGRYRPTVVEMELVGVRLELPSNTPIVLLREREGAQRFLPIFIGSSEANAIAMALDGITTPRPLTHDLIRDIFDAVGLQLQLVVVTALVDKTFYAELHLEGPSGAQIVSSRPSDAIAIAVRTGTPIHVAEEVLDEAGYAAPDDDEETEDEIERFREFIEHVDPEDFAS